MLDFPIKYIHEYSGIKLVFIKYEPEMSRDPVWRDTAVENFCFDQKQSDEHQDHATTNEAEEPPELILSILNYLTPCTTPRVHYSDYVIVSIDYTKTITR